MGGLREGLGERESERERERGREAIVTDSPYSL